VKHGFIRAPAMRVAMLIRLHLKSLVIFFQPDGNQHVGGLESVGGTCCVAVIFFLNAATTKLADFFYKPRALIYDRNVPAVFIFHENTWYIVFLTHTEVVRPERS